MRLIDLNVVLEDKPSLFTLTWEVFGTSGFEILLVCQTNAHAMNRVPRHQRPRRIRYWLSTRVWFYSHTITSWLALLSGLLSNTRGQAEASSVPLLNPAGAHSQYMQVKSPSGHPLMRTGHCMSLEFVRKRIPRPHWISQVKRKRWLPKSISGCSFTHIRRRYQRAKGLGESKNMVVA